MRQDTLLLASVKYIMTYVRKQIGCLCDGKLLQPSSTPHQRRTSSTCIVDVPRSSNFRSALHRVISNSASLLLNTWVTHHTLVMVLWKSIPRRRGTEIHTHIYIFIYTPFF
ncbi:conserved hypothetical protein, unlikely [Trypanosoma brucei gambiense DAL972]|uniref:Uncharacterized protein n=2 Tax=Trypanosoma brucei TaxID=5691 RepID=C9ZXL5_TRYB9|nr:conserved hypothetical protein, unlikely [Trypanosoma brucei gambiense DAL972]RHW70234.1 hypothetical protein DPX39_090018800 [Trypanosoma brucei equiperdum]CBH14159.1 conserved hypothetical protein, unlikely [Trypanosoma brucei gambiense DAL972]|eukprot:XP_011776430.1 conserved hypothetical protein, unlikely [Trypanosoma brucei gambiense DAL972]